MKNISLFILILLASTVTALPNTKGTFKEGRLYKGGQSGFLQSLLAVDKKTVAKTGTERVRFVFGDERGQKTKQPIGYFHVQHDVKNNRVVVDLAQLSVSRVNEEQIRKTLSGSSAIASVSFTSDPEDGSSTLVLGLKKPVLVRVAKQKTKFGPALALDLRLKR